MSKSIVSKRGMPKFDENPFISQAIGAPSRRKVTSTVDTNQELVDRSTGEVTAVKTVAMKWQELDSRKFIKVYVDAWDDILNLSSAGKTVFRILVGIVQEHKDVDRIYLSYFDVEERRNDEQISERTFHRGMTDLLSAGIIAESVRPNWYWLNLNVIFNGDSFSVVNSYRLKQKERQVDDEVSG